MTLNSFRFVVYFAAFIVVLALLQLVRRKYEVVGKAQLILLLLFSYFFIYKSSWKFCVSVLAYTCFVYVVGLFAKKNNNDVRCYHNIANRDIPKINSEDNAKLYRDYSLIIMNELEQLVMMQGRKGIR